MIPQNEMGVIVAFIQQAKVELEVISIGMGFPDAIIDYQGQKYRVEFEFATSGFYKHGHDPRKCDLIVCWENDVQDFILPVWELSKEGWLKIPVLPTEDQKEAAYWKQRAINAERMLEDVNNKLSLALSFPSNDLAELPKRNRILVLRNRYPDLSASAIATLAESSPSYVSEVLNGKADSIITETSPAYASEVISEARRDPAGGAG